MPKVVITDYGYDDIQQERHILSAFGAELVTRQCKTEQEVIDCTSDADAVICQFAPITKEVIGKMKHCKVIVRYAVGVDNIDVKAAEINNIFVCNVPDYGTEEVALHTVALIISSARKLLPMVNSVKSGSWGYSSFKPINRFSDSTVGLVGFGRIPQLVARFITSFGIKVLVHDPFVDKGLIESVHAVSVDMHELLSNSDYISLHIPLNKKTRNILNRDAFHVMKRKPFIINTARGGLISEPDLANAIDTGLISGAFLDVCESEPIEMNNPLLSKPDVYITPHSAWYSEESIAQLQRSVAEEVVRVLSGSNPKNPVQSI